MRRNTALILTKLVILFSLITFAGESRATVVVGLVHNGTVYIAADSASIARHLIIARTDSKVFKINDGKIIIGFASSFRMGQILRYDCQIDDQNVSQDIMEYMVVTFVNAVRKCFSEGGYASVKDGKQSGGFFLVGYKGRLFQIQSDYQVAEAEKPYQAIGLGSDIALGSLHTTAQGDYTIKEQIERALSAAAEFTSSVGRPFRSVTLEPK